jgi:hypothetical protein
MYEINIKSACPDSIMIPAGIRPLLRYQESSRTSVSVHMIPHPDLAQVAVLLLEHGTVDLGDPTRGVNLELGPVETRAEVAVCDPAWLGIGFPRLARR